jgi:hypothetical protein
VTVVSDEVGGSPERILDVLLMCDSQVEVDGRGLWLSDGRLQSEIYHSGTRRSRAANSDRYRNRGVNKTNILRACRTSNVAII